MNHSRQALAFFSHQNGEERIDTSAPTTPLLVLMHCFGVGMCSSYQIKAKYRCTRRRLKRAYIFALGGVLEGSCSLFVPKRTPEYVILFSEDCFGDTFLHELCGQVL